MKSAQLICILSLLFTLILQSCSSNKEKKFRIGFSQCQGSDDWRKAMQDEMMRELSFHDNVTFIYRDADANSKKQAEQIKELADLQIDLLIVSPNEIQPLAASIEKVFKSGIPVVMVDRGINSENYTAFIGASNFEVGQNAGRYAASVLHGNGKIIEIDGLPNASPFIARHNGFVDVISKYPGLVIEHTFSDQNKNYDQALEKALRTTPDIDFIFAESDYIAQVVYKVCAKVGVVKRVKVIGVDGLPLDSLGMGMVAKGMMSATVLYPTGGTETIVTALKILEHQPYKRENPLKTVIIDSTNVTIMQLQNQKLVAQQQDIDKRQKKIDLQKIITKSQSNTIIIITIILLAAVVLGALSYYFLKENKKISKRLKVQNKEIAEQRNQLIVMSEQAEVAHQAKLNFFTNISHEFRTPLTLILSPTEDLLLNGKLSAGTRQTVQLIQRNVMRLYKLVNQLMDFRKIEFSKMKVKAGETDLVTFVKEIADSYKVLAKNKHINLQFFTTEHSLPVWFDVTMIDKVVFNLLSNAFKFTKDNGYVHVTITKDKDFALIKIDDNGIGMTPDSIEHAFDPFFQGEYEHYKGTGLGLALSKEFIDMHHGSIQVKSEKWKGTQFEVRLPLGKDHFQENELLQVPQTHHSIDEDAKIYVNELLSSGNDLPNDKEPPLANKPCVLIAEDNDDLRGYLKSKLLPQFDVIDAPDGNLALQLAFDNVPDLIISDVVMPGQNGLDMTRLLKKDIRTAHIPIILLTARTTDLQKMEGLQTQADAYLTKPFNLDLLNQTIKNLLLNRDKVKGHYTAETFAEEKTQASKKTDRKFISEFSAIVENNLANDQFGVDDICKEMIISRVQLYRKVKALLNCNVNDYIVTTRLQKAKFYLQHEDLSISEIAFKTGFASAAYFSTSFKSKFGTTPSKYKGGKTLGEKS